MGDASFAKCAEILKEGWLEKNQEIGRRLDAMFVGTWADQMRDAVKLPPGLLTDPRSYDVNIASMEDEEAFEKMALVFSARALPNPS